MAEVDGRAPFAALGGKTPEELFGGVPTPCYIIDGAKLAENGEILLGVRKRAGCEILLAQKAFSCFNLYSALSPYLSGTEASGLYEARLGAEEMPGKEVHVFSAAYRDDEIPGLLKYADHVVFNSFAQLKKYGAAVKAAGKSAGIRINPECSTQSGRAVYDPCAPGGRLGVTRAEWDRAATPELLSLIDGLHFHTMCEQDADDLEITLDAVKRKFGDILPRVKWLNMGGGQHITRPGYNISLLERCVKSLSGNLRIYLEPGEAVALNAGFLASRVLDVVQSGDVRTAILDTSAACHMPDVLEMPYTPPVWGEKEGGYVYRLAGRTCLAGDVMGDYSLARSLKEGDLVLFGDAAIYTMCKNNTFNGMPLPAVYVRERGGNIKKTVSFGYRDFKNRLGAAGA